MLVIAAERGEQQHQHVERGEEAQMAKAKTTVKKKKAAPKAKGKGKATSKKSAPPKAKAGAKPTAVEKEVAALLDDYDNGQIDNALDVLPRMAKLDAKLPKASSLRRDFEKMLAELEKIAQSS